MTGISKAFGKYDQRRPGPEGNPIGERNKEVIALARNWCAHLEVRQSGGIGLVEIQTGLPIGMRSFKCPYAGAAGLAGMDLQTVALDFYDRNCADCKQRQPDRLPNVPACVSVLLRCW